MLQSLTSTAELSVSCLELELPLKVRLTLDFVADLISLSRAFQKSHSEIAYLFHLLMNLEQLVTDDVRPHLDEGCEIRRRCLKKMLKLPECEVLFKDVIKHTLFCSCVLW